MTVQTLRHNGAGRSHRIHLPSRFLRLSGLNSGLNIGLNIGLGDTDK